MDYKPKKERIVIKPNIVGAFQAGSPYITDVRVVGGVIDYLHSLGLTELYICGGAVDTNMDGVFKNFRLRYPQGHFFSPSALANSAGYNTVDIIDAYVKNQKGVHQTTLTSFSPSYGRSPACEPKANKLPKRAIL